MKSIFNSFSSVKLAIVLLIIITLTSILGTLIPQQRSPDEYALRYGQLANLFNRLQLTKLYQSLWFIGLLFLFALNITVCTLKRLTPKFRKAFRPKLEMYERDITVLKIKENFRKNTGVNTVKKEIKSELSSRHYRIKELERGNRIFLLAQKKILGWFGADVVHLGILIILAGGIISGLGGFRENLSLSEGQILPVPKADFKIRLDKFETEYYPNGSIRDWKSTLTVVENGKSHLTKIIEVNHPLSYKGFVFYQSSYGWDWKNPSVEILVKKRNNPSFLKKMELKVGERVKIEDDNFHISVIHFIPDFVITEKNEITTRSLQPNNPAVFIEGWQENEKIFSGWIFAKFPDFSRMHSIKETSLTFELKNFKANQYSIIQAAKDPGVNFIWLGSTFVMIGLALAFYWPHREIKVILRESNNETVVNAGGIASKGREAFQSEFKEIMTPMRGER